MSLRLAKAPLILTVVLLIPALLYGGLKGFMYYKAKRSVDEIVQAAAHQADIRYVDISTDLRGAVTVSGIDVQPLGYDDALSIASLRIASDDPMFFFRSSDWEAGGAAPPSSLSFAVSGISLLLSSDFMRELARVEGDASQPCAEGLQISPQLLRSIGFSEIGMDLDGHYRLNEAARTLELGLNMELHDIESMRIEATLAEVDTEALASGALPQVSLGGLSAAVRVTPEFGQKALNVCAAGTEQAASGWSEQLAAKALEGFEQQGLVLGSGLAGAVQRFYREWGEVKLVAAPRQPVGLMSLMFLPPDRLADTLNLQLSLNGSPIADTSFSWQGPAAQDLSALLGAEQADGAESTPTQPRRIIVRRKYEAVAVSDIARYVDHQVHIKPRGQPLREGLLKRIRGGSAEVEQSLHGGKFTVYVPLEDIESLQALVQREIGSLQ